MAAVGAPDAVADGWPQRLPSRRRATSLGRATAQPGTATMGTTGPVRREGRRVLDEVLVGAWEGLSVGRAVPCPLCGGPMRPLHNGRGADVVVRHVAGGACGDCGTALG